MTTETAEASKDYIFVLDLYFFTLYMTWWKLVGYLGTACFGLRWLVQIVASHRLKRSNIPLLFWLITVIGAGLSLSYWILSEDNNSVGVLQSLFPFFIAGYNIYLELRRHKASQVAIIETAPPRRGRLPLQNRRTRRRHLTIASHAIGRKV